MEAFDKVEELLLAEGYSKEEIPAIMISLVEQGFDPTAVFLGGIANMLDFLPKKKPPVPAPKVKPVADLLPDKLQPKAPKPEFGNNAVNPQPRVPKPELRPGGRTPEPQFRVTQPTNNVTPRRNNLSLQRTNLRAPSIPNPPARVPGLFSRLKGIRGGLASTALNLATAGAIDKYVVKPTGDYLGKQLAKGIISATGQQKLYPNLYGKQGPTLGVDTIKSIRARDAEAASKAVSGQRTNEVGQQSSLPSSGDPSTWPKGKQQPKPLSAAAKDFDKTFAAKRAAGEKEFTWRGKKYTTKLKGEDADLFDIVKGHLMSEGLTEEEALQKMLTMTEEERQSIVEQQVPIHPAEAAFNKSTPEARAANMKKYGTPYPPIDTSRRSGDRTAPAWMRGGFKSPDEYNKLDQATKDLLN